MSIVRQHSLPEGRAVVWVYTPFVSLNETGASKEIAGRFRDQLRGSEYWAQWFDQPRFWAIKLNKIVNDRAIIEALTAGQTIGGFWKRDRCKRSVVFTVRSAVSSGLRGPSIAETGLEGGAHPIDLGRSGGVLYAGWTVRTRSV